MKFTNFWCRTVVCLGVLVSAPAGVQAREITDMVGRTVNVPDSITRVYPAANPPSLAMMAIAPELMVGTTLHLASPATERFYPKAVVKLQTMGGGGPSGPTNVEQLLAENIDVAVGWGGNRTGIEAAEKQFVKIGKPVVFLHVDKLEQYPAMFRFLGTLLHREARGELLARAIEDALAAAKLRREQIPEKARVKVYYAESQDGLTSQCDSAPRAEVIALAGAINVVHCDTSDPQDAHATVDLETLMVLDPDVIVTRWQGAYDKMATDPRWQKLKAVRAHRVYAAPGLPFNWFDRPPSYMRTLGMEWLACVLYPASCRREVLNKDTRAFYTLFFGVELSDADLATLFEGALP